MGNLLSSNMRRLVRFPALAWVLGIFLFYELVNIVTTGFHTTLYYAYLYRAQVNWWELGFSSFLALVIGALVALTSVTAYLRYQERKRCQEGTVLAGIGAVGGLVTGFCPICTVSVVGLLFSSLGIGFSLGSLPFQGIEVQLLTIVLLSVSLWLLERR